MRSPLAAALRAQLIEAILPEVAFDGWSRLSLRRAAQKCAIDPDEASALFPEGAAALVAEFSRWTDRGMLERLKTLPGEGLSLRERVRRAVIHRLEILTPWREASRHALAILALPQNAPLAVRLLGETVDSIWVAAGEGRVDFSYYTRRLTLAAVYGATLLYFLGDRSADLSDTEGFLDRRLADLGAFGRARQRLSAAAERLSRARPYPTLSG
jgi:ubiquinone biosynthesis protein COQ9